MQYLSSFTFPSEEAEYEFRLHMKATCYQSIYPFYVLPARGVSTLRFRPLTILYGGNGSGKSTILHVIAEKLGLRRESPYNRSNFFEDYLAMCRPVLDDAPPDSSRIITSDDVFDYMLNIRAVNEGIDRNREELVQEYWQLRKSRFAMQSLDDYDQLHREVEARRKTMSRFVAADSQENIRERSNGESALLYFQERIADDSLCLLDEPENSLSPANQQRLASWLADSVRFCGCQLIVSTHSPFLLAIPGASVIDLDHQARTADSWTELEGVRAFYDFFMQHRAEFEKN